MANTKPEILPFAVDNAADCESYLFLNHPTTYIPLTSNPSDEHHSPSLSPRTPKSILKQPHPATSTVTFANTPIITNTTTTPAPPMERKSSTTSTTSDLSNDDEGFLGGGALRHVSGSHHLRELAELAQLDREAKAKREQVNVVVRKPGEEAKRHQDWLASVMQWWPENMEMAEHEWTEEFYD